MTHQRAASRFPTHLAPSGYNTLDLGTRPSTLGTSCSTPDLYLSPSSMTIAQSSSIPSLTSTLSASDLTSTSYTSIPVSNSSFSSFSTSISSEKSSHGYLQFEEKNTNHNWLPDQPAVPSSASPFVYLSSRRRRRPLDTLSSMASNFMRPIVHQLPQSLSERIVFLLFCAYLVVLLCAMVGIGGTPTTIDSACFCGPTIALENPINGSTLNTTLISPDSLKHPDLREDVNHMLDVPPAATSIDALVPPPETLLDEPFTAPAGTPESPDRVTSVLDQVGDWKDAGPGVGQTALKVNMP